MKASRAKLITGSIFASLIVLALTVGVFGIKANPTDDKQTKVSVPAEQVIESIRTAIAAKSGNVRGVDIESEDGKVVCEISVLAADGKTYEVEVDVATNTVLEIEEDDDNDKDDTE